MINLPKGLCVLTELLNIALNISGYHYNMTTEVMDTFNFHLLA